MWRALVFLGLICLAAYGAVWLANHPETIAVTWAGREYSASLAVGVVGLILAAILLSLLFGAMRALLALPGAIARGRRRSRDTKGRKALSRGIVAVGAGDVAAARRHAQEAEKLLGSEPLALLLKAQAAQASGNREVAEATFREMAERPDTRVLGLRGLYLEARRRGDLDAARHHAEEAARAAPAIAWASDAVLEGHSADGDWAGAVKLVERRTSLGLVDRAASRRQRAVLLTAEAMDREARDPEGALGIAQQAVKLAPDLVPAAVLAGRMLSRRGDLKRAAKVIETAWSAMPHPDLAGAYLNLRPGDSATDRLHRAETLARLSSWSAESRFAIARAAIESRELPRAREVLRPLLEDEERPTVRLCMLMAEIDGRGGNPGGAREWLARAARARRDKAWIADGIVSETWAPVSPVTGRLDTFVWDTPPEALGGASDGDVDHLAFAPEPEPAEDLPALKLSPPRGDPAPAEPPAPPPAAEVPPAEEPIAYTRPHRLADKVEVSSDAASGTGAPEGSGPDAAASQAGGANPDRKAVEPRRPAASAGAAVPPRPEPGPARPPEATPAAPAAAPAAAAAAPRQAAPNGGGSRSVTARGEPEPVIFPVPRPPDDPGLDSAGDRRQRFRLRV